MYDSSFQDRNEFDDPIEVLPEYTEHDRPACPICDELAGGCDHPEAESIYRAWLAT
jgi:hypothetical protein